MKIEDLDFKDSLRVPRQTAAAQVKWLVELGSRPLQCLAMNMIIRQLQLCQLYVHAALILFCQVVRVILDKTQTYYDGSLSETRALFKKIRMV